MRKLKRRNIYLAALAVFWWVLCAGTGLAFYHKLAQKESLQGSVKMESYIDQKMLSCQNSAMPSPCLKDTAVDFLKRFKLTDVLNTMKANEKKPEYFNHCHELAHYLGQDEFKRLGSVRAVFAESTEACLGGAYHGAVEGYFISKGAVISADPASDNYVGTEAAKLCGKLQDYSIPQQFTECNHGMGHALMFATDDDLIRALKLCDYLGSPNEQALCYTGAFMQNEDSVNSSDHPSKYMKAGDDLYPCYILGKKYQRMCYTYAVLSRFQYNPQKSVSVCQSVPAEFAEDCFKTYGRDRTMITADPNAIKSQCALIKNSHYYDGCLNAAAYNLVIRFGLNSTLPFETCALAGKNNLTECYWQITRAAKTQTLIPADINRFCDKLPTEQMKNNCTVNQS